MMRRTRPAGSERPGFTLVEMMVVILIIGLLVGLLIPAVMKVQDSARRAETNWEMNQITQAADLFCSNESMGKVGYLPAPPFRLRSVYPGSGFDYEINYLRQVFPNLNPTAPGGNGLPDVDLVSGNEIAMFFLTGGPTLQYSGFAPNSQKPFVPPTVVGEKRNGPYLQLKDTMYSPDASGLKAQLIDANKNPLAIFMSGQSRNYTISNGSAIQQFSFNGATVTPYYRGGTPKKYENPKGIQVISAGKDKAFGQGGDWNSRIDDKDSMDDVSNFSQAGLGYGPP